MIEVEQPPVESSSESEQQEPPEEIDLTLPTAEELFGPYTDSDSDSNPTPEYSDPESDSAPE